MISWNSEGRGTNLEKNIIFLGLVLDFLELRGEMDKPGINIIFLELVLNFLELRGEEDKPGINIIFLGLVLDFLELGTNLEEILFSWNLKMD